MNFPLVGNSKIRLAVENALKEHRLPHAILIDGDIGTGRHALADFLSLSVVCEGNDIPCGSCKGCHLAMSKNHPDITVIAPEDGKKSIAVAQIRELRANAYIKPHIAKSRVFIIDMADTLNDHSQNALLKILEEPPGNTVFILIAESKAAFLETIISRCIVLTLNSPSFEEGFEFLSENSQFEGTDIEDALKNTRNNIGKSLMLLQGNSDTKTAIAAKEFLEAMLRGNEWAMLEILKPFEKSRVEADRLFKDLKLCVAESIKKNPKGIYAACLCEFYNRIQVLEERLITNINLSLLFADLTSQAKECIN